MCHRFCIVGVMIREPPAAPVTKYKLCFDACSAMAGDIEDRGRLPGRMKLFGVGMYPNTLELPGIEKSRNAVRIRIVTVDRDQGQVPFIPSFMITPVSGTITCDPKRRFTVVVKLIANPLASAVAISEVPGVFRLSRPSESYYDTLWV